MVKLMIFYPSFLHFYPICPYKVMKKFSVFKRQVASWTQKTLTISQLNSIIPNKKSSKQSNLRATNFLTSHNKSETYIHI